MQETVLKMVEKDMISVLSHELRNCLALIQGNFQLIEIEHPEIVDVRQWSNIQEELDTMEELLQNTAVLRLNPRARFETGNFLDPLENVIEEGIGQINQKKIVFRKQFGNEVVEAANDCFFDAVALKRAFWNLLKNSIEACEKGGEIVVDVTLLNSDKNVAPFSEQTTTNAKLGKVLRIEFSNTGSVLPNDDLSKIFEPEFTTKADGSGLGLPVAKQVLDEYGAMIEAMSKDGKTKIVIKVPLK